MRLLQDKVCLVTGANRGIGASILERYVQEGAVVYAVARQGGCLDEIAGCLSREYGTYVIPFYFDVRESGRIKDLILKIKKEQGRLDVLVNNAAVMEDAMIGMVSRQLMQDTFDVNVFAVMELIQTVVKLMKRQGSGSIINFTSMVGVCGNPGQLVYSASKGAVIAMTKTAAKELAPFNIRVNAVSPGVIDTQLHKKVRRDKMEERLERIGMGRMGKAEEVAGTCVYLGSELSSYVTGQVIGVDGAAIV